MKTLAHQKKREQMLNQLAIEVRDRHRDCLHELNIKIVGEGVVLIGHATSFYGKQIAFHEVTSRLQLSIIDNRIHVQKGLRQ
jgi:hypothetical protein